jgi:hypothetical protein
MKCEGLSATSRKVSLSGPAPDGHFEKNTGGITIYTDSYTPAEVELLQSILLDKYGIKTSHYNNGHGKEQYIIRIPKREVPKLQALVKPYIAASMAYRVACNP